MATPEDCKKFRARKHAAGLCTRCPNPRSEGASLCVSCLAKRNAEQKARYHSNIEHYRKIARKAQNKRWRERPEEMRSYQRERYRKDPDRFRIYNVTGRYGITPDEYKSLELKQNGLCAICGKPPLVGKRAVGKEKQPPRLCVDHDHKTGKVRGLLCHWCNTNIIAGIEKSGASLEQIFRYLGGVS